MNKYNYLRVLQGHYGCGWEDLCCADNTKAGRLEIKSNLNDYCMNEGGMYRLINRRELKKV